MPCGRDSWPDWCEPDHYAALLQADRPAFAWEWLRRSPAYRSACEDLAGQVDQGGQEVRAARWGLHRLEPADLPAPLARPLWRRDHNRFVLQAAAERAGPVEERLDPSRFGALATIYRASSGEEHLLISDGLRSIRVDVVGGSICVGPARLHYKLSGLDDVDRPLLALRQLIAISKSGRFSPGLHRPEIRARRWIAMLRAHDALEAGATQREIAERLLSAEAAAPKWRIAAPTIRSRVQRLTRAAREMREAGYVSLLGVTQGEA